jgi:hypothetical protein
MTVGLERLASLPPEEKRRILATFEGDALKALYYGVKARTRFQMNIIDAMAYWPEFKDSSWDNWRVFLKALFGLPMSEADQAAFGKCTGCSVPAEAGSREAWAVVGRRGGKGKIAALISVYLAFFRDYSKHLTSGEPGVVMCLAQNKKQARIVFKYVKAMVDAVPELSGLLTGDTTENLSFSNGIEIQVFASNYRSVRGPTVVAVVCDEIAFWRSDESANPDKEIIDAIRPAMGNIPGSVLFGISSAYARRGELWKAFRDHYGKDSHVLVWRAPTQLMNPTFPQEIIDAAYEDDPAVAAAEYGSEFRKDVDSFLSREAIEAVTIMGRYELPWIGDVDESVRYYAFTDPSGGTQDAFTLAIGHLDGNNAVIDAIRETLPPFKPSDVAAEYAYLLKQYRIQDVTGDNYSAEWCRSEFRDNGIEYHGAKPKSEIYTAMRPIIMSGRCELLDHVKLRTQLESLDRRTSRAGKDSIDHPPGGHDDISNAVAGVVTGLIKQHVQADDSITADTVVNAMRGLEQASIIGSMDYT